MTEQDTSTYITDISQYWHEVIWGKLTDWNGKLKLKLTPISPAFNTKTYTWLGLNTMNFIEKQNRENHGCKYIPELNKWVSLIELLEAITIPRKVE